MKVSSKAIQMGVVSYVDNSLVPNLTGWQKWAFGAGAGLLASKGSSLLENAKQNATVKMLGIVDENGMWDIEDLFTELKKQAAKSKAVVDIPGIGQLTLTEEDVDSLYKHIKNAQEA